MQQGRSTIKAAAAAATSYVYLKNHSGKPTAMEIKLPDQSLEWNTNYSDNVFYEVNNGGNALGNNPVPVPGRSTIMMVSARTQCPDG